MHARFIEQRIDIWGRPSTFVNDVLNDEPSPMSKATPVGWLSIISLTQHVATGQRSNNVGAMSVITLPGRIVSINGIVKEQDFPMRLSKKTDGRIGSTCFGVQGSIISGIAKTGMICVNSAVGYTENDSCPVQPQSPEGVG